MTHHFYEDARINIITLIFLFSAIAPFSLQASDNEITVDKLATAVVFLRCNNQAYEMKSGEKIELWHKIPNTTNSFEPKLEKMAATGFLVHHDKLNYVVTAKHVAEKLASNSSSEMVVKLASGKIDAINFKYLNTQDPLAKWIFHPKADIAIHVFVFPSGLQVDSKHIPETLFTTPDKDINLLTPVVILGFPLGQGITDTLSPLVKQTQTASRITSIDIPNVKPDLKFILLGDALAQGYSGAPVFSFEEVPPSVKNVEKGIQFNLQPPPIIKVIGIQSGGLSDETGGKISVIIPIFYLVELFQSAEFKTYEAELHKKYCPSVGK